MMRDLSQTDLIKEHTVDIYDSSPDVAIALLSFKPRKVRLFTKDSIQHNGLGGVILHEFISPTAASKTSADVCMLDGSALKVLAVRYPSDAQFILARFAVRSGWLLGLPGLLRRLILGRIKLGGVVSLKTSDGRRTYWLLINKTKKTVTNPPLLLPKSVGAVAFFAWLRQENISYVVPRFYENLPELHREDGDLDLIVADADAEKVISYLKSLDGELTGTTADSIPIGLHTVSLGEGVPYYPPPIGRRILDRAIDGPAGSRIPEPTDAFNAFVYHVLYHHKGYATNIPSTLGGKPEHPPENDYGAIIKKKAIQLGIEVGNTMEDLDDYMASVGWRPKSDTLTKIAQKNNWVRDRLTSIGDKGSTGLTVYLLKEFAFKKGVMDKIVDHLKSNGLVIVRAEAFNEEQKKLASEHVRGGNWVDRKGNIEGMLPSAMIIAIDPKCASLPPAYAGEYERVWAKRRKQQLREAFDEAGADASVVHAADNTMEAWEYIDACFGKESDVIRGEVEEVVRSVKTSSLSRLLSPTYTFNAMRFYLRDFVTRRL